MGKLSVGGQSFIGSANLDHPANGVFHLARKNIPPNDIHVGMTGRLEIDLSGTHTVQITRREGPRVHFKILT
jgi:hypothetical protein